MTDVRELAGVGLPETLCITATKVYGGMLYWEGTVPWLPAIEGFLDGGSDCCGLLCTLVLPGWGWWECRQ